MNINNIKGFSLIELLVSMLVVAVAMLGFAALQAYSSRTITSSFTKNVGSNVVIDISRMFQMGVMDVAELDWASAGDKGLVIKCGREENEGGSQQLISLDAIKINSTSGKEGSLYKNVSTVCKNIATENLKGIKKAYLSVNLHRENIDGLEEALPKYFKYSIDILFAYQPLEVGKITAAPNFTSNQMNNYCPNKFDYDSDAKFSAAEKTAMNNRKESNIVCSRVEVNL